MGHGLATALAGHTLTWMVQMSALLSGELAVGWEQRETLAQSPANVAVMVKFQAEPAERSDPLAAQARPADVPISGRVVDLEGRPVPGVSISVRSYMKPMAGDLTPWLDAVRRGEPERIADQRGNLRMPRSAVVAPRELSTDDQGRFRLEGVGTDWKVALNLRDPSIALTEVIVVNRKIEPVVAKGFPSLYGPGGVVVYGNDCSIAVAPGRPVTGVVRDATTGQPVSGAAVESDCFAGSGLRGNVRDLKTVTDDRGQFRLTGFPKGRGNVLIVTPRTDQVYFIRQVEVPNQPGLDAVTMDVELHRGLLITGKVTDKRTGEPVEGARLYYLPFLDNKYAGALPEFKGGVTHGDWLDRYVTGPDGIYRLVGLPGRALVGVDHGRLAYRRGVGSESIKGMDKDGRFRTWFNPVTAGKSWPNTMKEIKPAEGAKQVQVDLELDAGSSVRLAVTDPGGEPLRGTTVWGQVRGGPPETISTTEFELMNFAPDEERTVILRHDGSKLGKVLRVKAGADLNGPVVIRLEPLATIAGQVLDADGQAIAGASVKAAPKPLADFQPALPEVITEQDGRFRIGGVPVGSDYRLTAEYLRTNGGRFLNFAWGDASVRSGETTDVGEIRFKKN